jgi:two-component system copper resistance phosphate regulon response regulator CusR
VRVLVVEDQKDLNEIISRKLTSEGYSVDSCFDGEEAEDFLRCATYDAIIMDIMMPGKTGIGVLRDLRAAGDKTPVLLLTALGTVDDRVAGLDSGADDYLVKPFDFDELLARVRAMIRRGSGIADNVIRAGDLTMDIASHTVFRGEEALTLTAKEYSILEYLLQNKGRVLSRDKLSNHIWNYDYDGASNVIDVYVHHLRKKVDGGREDKLIETVKGVGYIIR